MRVKKKDWEETDTMLKMMFLQQALGSIPLNVIYIWWAFGFSSVLWSLGHGVVITESVAGFVDWVAEYQTPTLQSVINKLQAAQARGPNAGTDYEKLEYKTLDAACQRLSLHNEPIDQADMEWVAGAMWQRRHNDKIKPCQGISAVTAFTTGHVVWDLLVTRLFGKKPFSWTAGILGSAGVFNLGLMLYMWVTDGSKKGEDEAQVAHSMHFGPMTWGAWLAYKGPGNPYW